MDLPVTLILIKLVYTYSVFENDVQMVDEEKCEELGEIVGCSVKNIGILEDMAKVNHIFCDKTGTLTKNQLIF